MRGLLRGRWKKASNQTKQVYEQSVGQEEKAMKHMEKEEEPSGDRGLSLQTIEKDSDSDMKLQSTELKNLEDDLVLVPVDTALSHDSSETGKEEKQESLAPKEVDLGEGPRVLILDDDNQILEIVGEIVLSIGGVPLKALNGAHAMDWVQVDNIQLVILDLHMPEMNGVDFLKGVRRIGALSDVPVFILTGRPDKNILEKLKPLGVHGCIVKPFHPEDLKELISRHLTFSDNSEVVESC